MILIDKSKLNISVRKAAGTSQAVLGEVVVKCLNQPFIDVKMKNQCAAVVLMGI
jgi:hypothetical protein